MIVYGMVWYGSPGTTMFFFLSSTTTTRHRKEDAQVQYVRVFVRWMCSKRDSLVGPTATPERAHVGWETKPMATYAQTDSILKPFWEFRL